MGTEYWLEDKVPVCIVGGGILGLAAGYALAKRYPGLRILEKNSSVGAEQSGHSSGVVHDGPYYPEGSQKAIHCIRGNILMYEHCSRHAVPCRKIGKHILAMNQREDDKLWGLQGNAEKNGVKVNRLKGDELQKREPNITAYSALFLPDTGVVDAGALVKSLESLILQETAPLKSLLTDRKVVGIENKNGNFVVRTENSRGEILCLETEFLINAAGLYADKIARMVNPENQYELLFLRGEYYSFDSRKRPGLEVQSNIYFLPEERIVEGFSYLTLGIHVTPRLNGEALSGLTNVGPAAQLIQRRDDYGWSREEGEQGQEGTIERLKKEVFYDKIKPALQSLEREDLTIAPTGIWANLKGQDDFALLRDSCYHNCLHLLGCNSPALTACFSLGEEVAHRV